MLKTLTPPQMEILQRLSDKYLVDEDPAKNSIEVVTITELAVVFWYYPADGVEGQEITMPWFEFVVGTLAPALFGSQHFKFNGVVSKCIMRPLETREDLLSAFDAFDIEMEEKLARKLADAENKRKADEKGEKEIQTV